MIVTPLPTLKDTHHRSELHGEGVCFFKVGMSAIWKKWSVFCLNIRIFCQRGSIFSIIIEQSPPHFLEKGSLLSAQNFHSVKVSVL